MAKDTTTNDEAKTDGLDEAEVIGDGGHEISRMTNDRYRGPNIVSNLDLEDPDVRIRLYNAQSAQATSLGTVVGKELYLTDWVATRTTLQFKNKDPYKGCRLIVWDKDGKQYFTSSKSICQAIGRLVEFFGPNLSEMGRPLVISNSRTSGGDQWFNVELAAPKKSSK